MRTKAVFAMESSNHFWLDRLFPPHFSKEDFFTESHQLEPLICEKFALERARKTRQLYSEVVKVSFHEDQQSEREGSLPKQSEREGSLPKLLMNKHLNIWGTERENSEGSTQRGTSNSDAESGERKAETGGHCTWATKELAVLRQEMRKEHMENISAKLQVSLLRAELVEFKAKYESVVAESEQAMQELSNYRTEAWCKTVQLEQIQRQLFERDSKIEGFKQGLLEKSDSIRSLKKELKQTRGEVMHLELQKKDLQRELKDFREQQGFQNKLVTEKVKLCQDMEMRKLQKEVEDAKRELEAEKVLSAKRARDLELLKKHFSGQSSADSVQNLSICFI